MGERGGGGVSGIDVGACEEFCPAALRRCERFEAVGGSLICQFGITGFFYQMKQGKNLVDIGATEPSLNPAGLGPLKLSVYYSMELERVKGYPQYRQDPQPQWDLRNK
ncbi:hypothetical protein [Rathayibacter toxicus]|uniref:hypothetical protein n=1 Tax=Rathayibacter toxicus TaxID=145458 RepID=UPI001C05C8B1|nr:hypothetical protein [Rathayibacter toxicus]QWL31886.1 hypothetical protein E2R35_02865 [Rathayibacter toxicus]QWL33979.1 hypothetical protein E2R36_02865 [Rathayibacter toxicus]QWL36111.1 hypothetical protein E2R37_02860 [Rathayibacter toxicus]QWL38202.1 hypothetical protein E2R38_02860 [Rathayibacter toxicus]QWL40291.1 hypothetical protein E2R39_02865 [Rathayibacter toxicus]